MEKDDFFRTTTISVVAGKFIHSLDNPHRVIPEIH
jgi:hypothetical protein